MLRCRCLFSLPRALSSAETFLIIAITPVALIARLYMYLLPCLCVCSVVLGLNSLQSLAIQDMPFQIGFVCKGYLAQTTERAGTGVGSAMSLEVMLFHEGLRAVLYMKAWKGIKTCILSACHCNNIWSEDMYT